MQRSHRLPQGSPLKDRHDLGRGEEDYLAPSQMLPFGMWVVRNRWERGGVSRAMASSQRPCQSCCSLVFWVWMMMRNWCESSFEANQGQSGVYNTKKWVVYTCFELLDSQSRMAVYSSNDTILALEWQLHDKQFLIIVAFLWAWQDIPFILNIIPWTNFF